MILYIREHNKITKKIKYNFRLVFSKQRFFVLNILDVVGVMDQQNHGLGAGLHIPGVSALTAEIYLQTGKKYALANLEKIVNQG